MGRPMHTTDSLDIDSNDELLTYARSLIANGYYSEAQISELLQDWVEGEGDEQAQHARIATVIEQAIATQLKEQESYPAVTDYERLRQAFGQLEAAGFLVRENYTCCQSCGWSEANAELAEAAEQNRRSRVLCSSMDKTRMVQ